MGIYEFIANPWPWWFSGIMISGIMFVLIFWGKSFGFSSNLRTLCAMTGCGTHVPFFNFNWKDQMWNITFLVGALAGGYIAKTYLISDVDFTINENTLYALNKLGFSKPIAMQPDEIFAFNGALNLKSFVILATGGLMVGFGSRYAGGCTSGHAISGLSNLQWPSLITVIGFFIGGLTMTHFLFPLIF